MRRVALLLLLLTATHATAETIGVRGTEWALQVYGAETGTVYATGLPAPCCFIGTGASARDAANDRQWIGAFDEGIDVLYRFDAAGTRTTLVLPANNRVEVLAFDAPREEVVALLRDRSSDALSIQRYSAKTGVPLTNSVVSADCCTLRAGVSTWSPQQRRFILLGQRSGDAAVGVLSIDVAGTVQAFAAAEADTVQALSVNSGNGLIYALRHDPASSTTTLQQVVLAGASATITAIGSGEVGCCFVLAGSAVVDGNRFQVFAYPIGSVTPTLYRFDLSSGAASPLPTTAPSAGLHIDASVPVTASIFRDGFE